MLSRRMQIQAIADVLAGLPLPRKYRLAEFEDPWSICYRALLDAAPRQAPGRPVLPAPEAQELVSKLARRLDIG